MGKHRKQHSGDDLTIEQRRELYYLKVCHIIEKHGFFIQAVMAGGGFRPFAHSGGLAPAMSELTLFGLPDETAGQHFPHVVPSYNEGRRSTDPQPHVRRPRGKTPRSP